MKREVRGAWTGVEIGDEVAITYDDEPGSRGMSGTTVDMITSIVDKSSSLLIAEVDFVDGFGTIRDDRKYQIKIRGARILITLHGSVALRRLSLTCWLSLRIA